MVNQQILEGHWEEIKGAIREHWGHLSNDELEAARGDADQFLGMLERRTGEAREKLEPMIREAAGCARTTVEEASEQVRQYAQVAGERATEYAAHMQEAYEQGCEAVSDQAKAAYIRAERTVRKRPLESVATCFGAGLLAGLLIGVTMRSR